MPAPDLPPLTLIHGIGGRPGHVAPLGAALVGDDARRQGAVVAPALPGHGPRGDTDAPLPRDVAGTAAWLAERVPVAGRLLVGHSTGGVVALALAGIAREAPAGVVVLDSNVPVAPDAVAARRTKADLARRAEWRAALRASLARDWRGPEPWRERVFADLDATPDEPMRSLWESVLTVDTRGLWAGVGTRQAAPERPPVLYVRSTRAVAAGDLAEVTAEGVAVTVVEAGERLGHWPHLVRPDAVAGCVRRWWRHAADER